jgi:NAD(P)-dependent dehydrogenase (short-subunit alcohol dehydrogenase family)
MNISVTGSHSPLTGRLHNALASGPVGSAIDWLAGPRVLRDEQTLRKAVEGTTVVLTGASFGLGAATARLLARAGATVIMGARTVSSLEEIAADITAAGGQAVPLVLDLTDPQSVDEFAREVLQRTNRIDFLIHNAGRSLRRSLHLSYDRPNDLTSSSGVNYLGPMRLTMKLLPRLREQRAPAHIVNVSTVGVQLPPVARWGFYVSSKAAFESWLRSVVLEASAEGVSLTTIYAGLIHTRMSAPSGWMRHTPGRSPERAALVVARAVAKKPRVLSTSYGLLATWLRPFLRTPIDIIGERFARWSGDTPAALVGARRTTGGMA